VQPIGRDGVALSEPARAQPTDRNAGVGERISHGVGARLGESLVVLVAPDRVGVTLDGHAAAAPRALQDVGDVRGLASGVTSEIGPPELEEHVRQIDDHAA